MKGSLSRIVLMYGAGVFGLALVLLFAYAFHLQKGVSYLEESNALLEKNFQSLQRTHELLKKDYTTLKSEHQSALQESAELRQDAQSMAASVDETLEHLQEFQNTVQNSIAWFKENRNIASLESYASVREDLHQCMDASKGCRIDLECIYAVNKKNKFAYHDDASLTGKDDFLFDLDSIFHNKGGDCEDISMLYRAEYNYLVDQCLNSTAQENITSVIGDREFSGTHMYVICGGFDPKGKVRNWAGHCLVSLGGRPINSSSDIYDALRESVLIEPQTGEFVADMGTTDVITLYQDGDIPQTLHYVWMVITDDDLKIFYKFGEETGWVGYRDFEAEAYALEEGLTP